MAEIKKVVKEEPVVRNAFFPQKSKHEGQTHFAKEYEEKKVVQVVVKTGEGDQDYVIKNKVITKKIPIDEYIQSFADTVGMAGLVNGLKNGSVLPGDLPRYNPDAPIADYSNAPEDIHEAMRQVDQASDTLKGLNQEMNKKMTFEQFLENVSKEDLEALYKAAYEKKVGKQENE